jgi:hypothetical protein
MPYREYKILNGIHTMVARKRKENVPRFFIEEEIVEIESANPSGLSSGDIVDFFASRGMRFSEATFRKYVQLGLLPRSRRVGSKGKHKGSKGIYPTSTIRQIVEIKKMMALDYTIEEICRYCAFVGGEIEELRVVFKRTLNRLEESLSGSELSDFATTALIQQINSQRESAEALVGRIENIAERIRQMRQVAKEAV